jgi:hypothetical protein
MPHYTGTCRSASGMPLSSDGQRLGKKDARQPRLTSDDELVGAEELI